MDTYPNTNPNYNYNKMISIIDEAKKKHMPIKIVKFSKHKKSEWITKGIIESVKFRDKLHNKMKTTARDSPDYNTYKTNISTYSRILKKSIRIAKCLYYSFCFNKYKKDIKKTWQTINDIMHRKINSTSNPEYFEQSGIKINDKRDLLMVLINISLI